MQVAVLAQGEAGRNRPVLIALAGGLLGVAFAHFVDVSRRRGRNRAAAAAKIQGHLRASLTQRAFGRLKLPLFATASHTLDAAKDCVTLFSTTRAEPRPGVAALVSLHLRHKLHCSLSLLHFLDGPEQEPVVAAVHTHHNFLQQTLVREIVRLRCLVALRSSFGTWRRRTSWRTLLTRARVMRYYHSKRVARKWMRAWLFAHRCCPLCCTSDCHVPEIAHQRARL